MILFENFLPQTAPFSMFELRTVVILFFFAAGLPEAAVTFDRYSCAEALLFSKNFPLLLENVVPKAQRERQQNVFSVPSCLLLHEKNSWWSYEFCFDKWTRQFHQENSIIMSEYFLGFGPHSATSDDALQHKMAYTDGLYSLQRKVPPIGDASVDEFQCMRKISAEKNGLRIVAVTTEYNRGTYCTLTQKPRTAKIIALCDMINAPPKEPWDTPVSVQFNVSEVEPCSYVIYVYGRLVCKAMGLSPAGREADDRTEQSSGCTKNEGMGNEKEIPRQKENQFPEDIDFSDTVIFEVFDSGANG